jgi:outer membrane receptor protein involved in Fe transport
LRGGIFGQVQWTPWLEGQEPRIQLTGGARLDFNTFSEAAFSPRAAAVFQAWPGHYFRLSYGLAFRKPSIFESRIHIKVDNYNPSIPEIVDLLADQLGNEELENEKVHSFEAGWRARFLDDRLRLSVDLFYSMYRDTIVLVDELAERFGLPYIADSILEYRNEGSEVDALGGELELNFRPSDHWSAWCNLGYRRVAYVDGGELSPFEPQMRVNLGGRFLPQTGMFVDIALHYVSKYEMPGVDPTSSLGVPPSEPLGDSFLLIGRIGYRLNTNHERLLEVGLTVQAPLGAPFREFTGVPLAQSAWTATAADFGGEMLTRLASLYLRGRF